MAQLIVLLLAFGEVPAEQSAPPAPAPAAPTPAAPAPTAPEVHINYVGKVETTVNVKATFGGKPVNLPIVNGLLPDQLLEGIENGKLVYRAASYAAGVKYDKQVHYVYAPAVLGPTITEFRKQPRGAAVLECEYRTRVYQLQLPK